MLEKICTKCNILKPISEYYTDNNNKSGYRGLCKQCISDNAKNYRLKNKVTIAINKKEYAKKYKDSIAEYQKEYAIKNKQRTTKYKKEYYKKNKSILQEKGKAYYVDNLEKIKKYKEENSEKIKKSKKLSNLKHKEKISKYRKEYRLKNKEKIKKYHSEYMSSEKGLMSARNSRHKRKFLRLNGSDNTIPDRVRYPLSKELQDLLDIQNNKCNNCGCSLTEGKHLDHWVPLSKGGTHSIDNVVWLCPTCNMSKHNKVPDTLLLI